jgi:hypothetical protein
VQSFPQGRSLVFHAPHPVLVAPGAFLELPIVVSGVEAPLVGVDLALQIRHGDLRTVALALVSPHSRTVLLSRPTDALESESSDDDPTHPLVFSAEEPAAGAAVSRYVGKNRAVSSLSAFHGLAPCSANGCWRLVVIDISRSGARALIAAVTLNLRY